MSSLNEKSRLLNKMSNDDDDYDPYLHREVPKPLKDYEAIIHFLKGVIGTGILAMPEAFKYAGMINGLISLILIAIICTYCLHLLVKSQYILCKKLKVGLLPYPDSMKAACEAGPEFFHFFTPVAHQFTVFLYCMYQFGVCCIYAVFIADNLKYVIDFYDLKKLSTTEYLLILFVPCCLIMCVPDLKMLAPLSLIATIITFITMGIIFYFVCRDLLPFEKLNHWGSVYEYPLFFGTSLFALQAPAVVTATENNMGTPKHFGSFFGVLNISMCISAIIYILVAILGYWRYGDDIKASITLNFPPDEIVGQIVRVLYSVAIYMSFGLQGIVPVQMIWYYYFDKKVSSKKLKMIWEYVMRLVYVILVFIFSIAVPYLGLIISLFGAFCLSFLGIILPAFMEISTTWPDKLGWLKWIFVQDILLILLGFVGCVAGCYSSLSEIILKKQGE